MGQEKNTETKKEMQFYLDKGTVERFVAVTTARSMAMKERLNQKYEKIIDAVPGLGKVYHKVQDFDKRMEKEHGQVYVKIRNSIYNISRTLLAAHMFGLPGVVGVCVCKTCESTAGLLEPAEKARQEGKVSGIFDFLKKNREEAAVSTTNSALTVASTACEVVGAVGVEEAVRAGKASLLMGSELKTLGKTFHKWIKGKASFKDVRRDAVVAGITFATYFADDVPMTRGEKIKPEEETKDEKKEAEKPVSAEDKKTKNDSKKKSKSGYKQQVGKLFAQGIGNPSGMITIFDVKAKQGGR
ncbi:MAG: hypothetical protein IJ752_02635 [Alphaproteobacteria bacterium]|nr:hypothetical protein [Alphaproteobacteria bacterium]